MFHTIFLGSALLALWSIAAAAAGSDTPVIGWYTNQDLRHWETVDKSRITHLFFSDRHTKWVPGSESASPGVCSIPTRQFGDSSGDIEEYAMPRLVKYREEYKFKIILMLGGWGGSHYFAHCSQEANREQFATAIYDYLVKYNFDGVDLDWEHIGIGGACDYDRALDEDWGTDESRCWMTKTEVEAQRKAGWKLHTEEDFPNFVALLTILREKFDSHNQTATGRELLITSAMSIAGQAEECRGKIDGGLVYTHNPEIDHYVPCKPANWGEICDKLDLMNVMLYDVWGGWSDTTGHHAPFSCDPNDPHMQVLSPPFTEPCKPRLTVKNAINFFLNPEVPGLTNLGKCAKNKLAIGMPLYGKGMCATDGLYKKAKTCDAGNSIGVGPTDPNVKDILSHGYYLNTPQYFHNVTNDQNELVATYYYNPETKHYVSLDTPSIIYEKTKWAAETGIAGYFFWSGEMDFDNTAGRYAFEGWYAGKGRAAPDGVNYEGEFRICQAGSARRAAFSVAAALSVILVTSFL